MRPATNTPPPLTETDHERQRIHADAAMLEFVKALARQQATEDHLRDTRQDEIYDPRRDLRPAPRSTPAIVLNFKMPNRAMTRSLTAKPGQISSA